eukprot:NODE_197_length_15379_cov_0.485602.p7 type:complete len:237 gc:universal NODE_197_length_15379_cov_0.485602:9365-10075(+)
MKGEDDYDLYLEGQLNELTFKHTALTNNHINLRKEHQLLLEQYDRLQQDLTDIKLSSHLPKSRSLGDLDKKSSEYFSSADISPILNIEAILTKIERSKFKPVSNFDRDYEFSCTMIKKIKQEVKEEKNDLFNDLILIILDTQAECNLYHYKYAQMVQEKDLSFRNNYYRLPGNFNENNGISVISPPTISSVGQSSIKTFTSNVFKAIARLGSSMNDLATASKENAETDPKNSDCEL